MFSRVFCIAFALGVTSFATGLVRERRSAYETALKCTKAGWNADVFALRAKGPRVEDGCIYLRVRLSSFLQHVCEDQLPAVVVSI